ncbi:AraC family transcriptional regulator [Dyadobacter sp. 3J3]|uniref:helix-turn-helix domain-containing protein n=1 Tax=Dyadobacter sp. 3J3 TaxID=2606600 RepID=UPI0013598262|nr:helix-turn-helix domain-containing protein [Dyadobacter sp. 3J3]
MKDRNIASISEFGAELRSQGFKVFEIKAGENVVRTYNRKDFYKICLVTGCSLVQYADRGIEIDAKTLFFGNPHIPYSWEIISEEYTGYTCLFSESFLKVNERSESLQESPLFKIGGTPIFTLSEEQRNFIATIFQKMIAEDATGYMFKQDLMRNYISLLIHEALKMQPAENFYKHKNAAERTASLFFDLLERQFPIESIDQPMQFKTAQEFANRLSVHVNHLNRSVKEITGKPTSAHIAERIIMEAKALLIHTDWTIAEIGYALGFEYPAYFNNYFKRLTGTVPSSVRMQTA